MFDISWTEFLLIGVVALIVIGPKELPGVLRMLGQWTRKVRSMAADFQNQFQEAMREAEMADLKKQVDDLAHDFKDFDPLKDVREDVEAMGRDIEHPLDRTPDDKAAVSAAAAAAEPARTDAPAAAPAPAPVAELTSSPASDSAVPVAPVERNELETVGSDVATKPPEPPAQIVPPDSTERTA